MTETTAATGVLDEALLRVRRALVARYGSEAGLEAASDVTEWAVANATEVSSARNPAGLLYRVGQSRVRRYRRWSSRPGPLMPARVIADRDPALVDLFEALRRLPEQQRIAVVLVHAHGERYADVAEVLGISVSAVTNHVHRGLRRLRQLLETNDA